MKRRILPLVVLALLLAACPKPKPTPPAPAYVTVTVCSESGLLPNPYCPATEARQFIKGSEPTTVCTVHHAPVPPPVCSIPYRSTGKLLVVADACLTIFCTKDSDTFKASDIPDYLDAITVDGMNAVRGFIESNDAEAGHWESYHLADAGYEVHLRSILAAIKARDLTAIVCVTPYGGAAYSDVQYNQVLSILKDYLPNVIVEAVNEPTDMILAKRVIDLALAAGFAPQFIQAEFVDSGEYYDELTGPLQSKAVACLHFVASMDDINAPWPAGWSTSGGMMQFVSTLGLYPSSDGGTHGHNGQFPFPEWAAHPDAHTPSAADCYAVTKWALQNGGRGYEWLSPASFPTPYPSLRAAIGAGQTSRAAMRQAYAEVFVGARSRVAPAGPFAKPTFPLIPGAKRMWPGR